MSVANAVDRTLDPSKDNEWIPVLSHKRPSAKRTHDLFSARQRVSPQSIQQLIRARMERLMNQDAADELCHFPRHTIREIECHRILPSVYQMSILQRVFGVTFQILSIMPSSTT